MWIGQLTEHQAEPLRESCEAWAAQNVAALYGSEPELPPGMINRAAEVWWALLAIADLVGGEWPARARAAARALSTGGDDRDDRGDQVLLLADLFTAFTADPVSPITPTSLGRGLAGGRLRAARSASRVRSLEGRAPPLRATFRPPPAWGRI
jgi:hypothetical protein